VNIHIPSIKKSTTIITNYLTQQKHSQTITKGIVCPIWAARRS